jgi:DNA-binding CsgD family transcriptional regulator
VPPSSRERHRHVTLSALSSRECQIICLVTDGLTNPKIAAEIGTTLCIIKDRIRIITDKTGTFSRLELALWSLNHSAEVRIWPFPAVSDFEKVNILPYNLENGSTARVEERTEAIRTLFRCGMEPAKIAVAFGIRPEDVSAVLKQDS